MASYRTCFQLRVNDPGIFLYVCVMMISVLPTNPLYHMYLTAKKASKCASMMNLGLCLK